MSIIDEVMAENVFLTFLVTLTLTFDLGIRKYRSWRDNTYINNIHKF